MAEENAPAAATVVEAAQRSAQLHEQLRMQSLVPGYGLVRPCACPSPLELVATRDVQPLMQTHLLSQKRHSETASLAGSSPSAFAQPSAFRMIPQSTVRPSPLSPGIFGMGQGMSAGPRPPTRPEHTSNDTTDLSNCRPCYSVPAPRSARPPPAHPTL